MDSVLRALAMYAFLWVIFRISGKRTLAEMNSFDVIMLLVISETTQQAMIDDDNSFLNAFLLITTWVGLNIALAWIREIWPGTERYLDGVPVVILEDGRPNEHLLRKARVDVDDIMTAAREKQGLERLDQIKYAVLERSGGISIVPKDS